MKRVISFFNKSKNIKILTNLYIIYIVLFALYMYLRPTEFNIIIDNDIDGPLNIVKTINLIISNSIIYLIFSLLVNFHITALYLGLFISYKIHQKQKLEIIDYKNNNIFRDILKEYSPGELGYIDDFQISENHIIATILDLELKNKIKIEESITVIDSDESNLLSNEKYILSNIKNNSYLNVNLKVFERKVLDDLERSELMDIKKPPNKTKKIITILCILLLYAIYILFIANREYEVSNPIVAFFLIPISLFINFFPFVMIVYYFNKKKLNISKPHIRSKKGSEINEKLEGLKKYIKEFSILPEREQKEIKIWKEYLIYSVMFNMNNKIVEEIKRKLNV